MTTIKIIWCFQEEKRIEVLFANEVKEITSIILIDVDLTI
jgi:hypothetical protein